ncbi:MAG: hypothetical protein EPO28_07560 [Saprospiraceae bacterium]|nr:MAG: hypothetical protein EPO28_07560 [Saprospiraceae bacterium]
MSVAEVLEKIDKLPDPVQHHLFLYVDFLYNTYFSDETGSGNKAAVPDFFDTHELSEAGKSMLEQRAAQAMAHPEKRLPWREARAKIHKKHNLPS